MIRKTVVVLCCATLATSSAVGQQTGDQAGRKFCGRPAPTCGAFITVDAGMAFAIHSSSEPARQTPTFPWAHFGAEISTGVGVMFRRSDASALGGGLYFGSGDFGDYARLAPEVRYRRWLGGKSSLDLSAGPVWVIERSGDIYNAYLPVRGVTFGARLGANEFAALTLRSYLLQGRGERTQAGTVAGIQLGSFGIPIAAAAALLVALGHSVASGT